MVWRNGWKSGDWLVQDEESGATRYASQTRRDWQGLVVTSRYADPEQSQDFIKPLDDPRPVDYMSRIPDVLTVSTTAPAYAGRNTLVRAPLGAANHLFTQEN